MTKIILVASLGMLAGFAFAHAPESPEADTTLDPTYLSISATDKAFIDDLAAESRGNGECVNVDTLTDLPNNAPDRFWLHSCEA